MTTMLKDDFRLGKLGRRIICQEGIQNRIRGLAKEISAFYEWEKDELIVIGIADGANIFVSDLVRQLPFKLRLEFIKIKTYAGTKKIQNSVIRNIEELLEVENKNILIVDDIYDTGETLNFIINEISKMNPKTIKTCVLLNKNTKKEYEIKSDFVGFNIENVFVVGFGLDCSGYYRNLQDICVFNP